MVHVLLKLGLENFEHYFSNMWDECNCAVVWTSLALPFLGIGMKTDLFQSCGHCCFPNAGILSAALSQHHLLGFEIAQPGNPSPPLALFIVMLPKAHLTLPSGISGSRWVITPLWLSGPRENLFGGGEVVGMVNSILLWFYMVSVRVLQ